MAANVGSLNVDLALGTERFKRGLGQTQADLRRAAAQMEATSGRMARSFDGASASIGKMGGAMKAAGAAALAGFSIAAVKDLVSSGLEYASSLGEVAQQLGVGTTALQTYRYAATQTGISQDAMDKGLARLTRSIGEAAAGAKGQTAAFNSLGVSVRDANGQIRPTEEVMRDLVAAFSAIKDPAARARMEMTLFGKSGQQLDTLLAGGVDQLNNLSNAAQRLGVVLSPEQIQKADDAADAFGSVKTMLSANIAGVVADNADAIFRLANAFTTAASAAGGLITRLANAKDMAILNNPGLARFGARNTGQNPDTVERDAAGRLMSTSSGRKMVYWDYRNRAKALDGKSSFDRNGVDRTAIERNRLNQVAREVANAEFRARKQAANAPRETAPVVSLRGGGGGGGGRSARGGGGGGGRAGGVDRDASALQSLYDRLYPDDAKDRAFLNDLALLESVAAKGGAEADKAAEAIRLLKSEARGEIETSDSGFNFATELKTDVEDLSAAIAAIPVETIRPTWDQIIDANARMARSFVDAAQEARYSLRSLSDAVKSGDFLSILDAGLRLFELARGLGSGNGGNSGGLLGSIGKLFGSVTAGAGGPMSFNSGAIGSQTSTALRGISLPRIPGFATGGEFEVGGSSGVDTNLIQFRATKGEIVNIRRPDDGERGGVNVHMSITYSGAVDIADRKFVVQMSEAARVAAMNGVAEARRRGG